MAEIDNPTSSWPKPVLQRLFGGGGLAARGRRASVFATLGSGGHLAIKLVSNLALTRLLTPEIFGLMALAQVFLQGINMLSDVGTKASVIRSDRGEDVEFLQTAWTVQALRGAIVMLITLASAWPVSQLYDEPLLFPVISAISLTALFGGLSSISVPLANRKLMLWKLTLANLASRVLVTVITIISAWMLQSVWALVIGAVIGSMVHVVMTHVILPPFLHRFRLEPEALREIITFGRWILLATACAFVANQGQKGIFGLLVPFDVLGTIAIATLIASVPQGFFEQILRQVIFPSFSEIRRERPQHIPRVLRKVRLVVILTFLPMMFLISALSQPIIDLLYDERYALAGLFLALIPLNNAVAILVKPYQNLLLADGASHLHAFLMALSAVLTAAGIVVGFWVYGIVGSVTGVGVAFALLFITSSVVAHRRGYGTGGLDVIALGLIGLFYTYTLFTRDLPPGLTAA